MASTRPVLVAPDKFKGTLGASEAAAAIGRGLLAGGVADVTLLPVADGGEGSMEAMVRARGGRILGVPATDALGRDVGAAFGVLEDGRIAIVEQAQASGLWRLADFERDVVGATSRGTGELMRAAIDAGAREIVVTVGGSATTDGGRGALEALGAHFTSRTADLRELQSKLRRVRIAVAADVRSPMCGPDGAAHTFAPQKGASPDQVEELEQRLVAWARLARQTTERDPSSEPMAGAGGGLAGGLWAFAGAALRPGAALILDTIGFDAAMRDAFAVVTGEGSMDRQTLRGKAVFEVATRCRQGGVPCYAVPGADRLEAFEHRLINVEVEPAARNGAIASEADVERAARRLANRLIPGRP
jgi:glycerate 2-kinase